MASNKKNRYKLSKGRKEQLAQARQNAKDDYNRRQKEKQNKALIQQYNATHKNAPKQTISAKGGSRNTRHSTGTTRSTASKTRMNGSLGNSFGGSKTGGANTTANRRASAARKADAERRQSTTLRQGSSYLTGGSTRKATPYAAAQQVYTPLRSNDRRARAGRAADANRTINGSLGNSFGGKLPTAARNTQETTTTEDRRARIGRKADEEKKQRQTAIDTLNANSVRWHNTTDETEKNRLHAVNNRIRSMYGMTYEGKTGRTYLPTAGQNVNVSHPVELYSGAEQPQTEFNTQEDKDKRYKEIQSEIDRMKKAYTGLSNFHFGMSENNKADKDAKKQLIKTLEDERNAVTGGTTRKVQAAKSIGNQIVGSPAALAETAQQQSANVEESRKNPEYVRLEQLQEQLELTLAGLPSTDADGKPPAEYMNVYNQLQYVKEQKDKLAVKTTVDPNKWGQQKLTKAAEQKANATTGMTEGKKFAADTAIGVAGNAPQMAASFIPVVGPAIGATWSGVNAAGQRSYELNQQGVAPNESLGRGIVSGVIEAATEKSPMEILANIATKGGKGLVSNIAKQALSEAGEESLGYAANYAADVAANDPNAHFSLSELGQNALGGAAGGAMFGGIGTGIHALRKGVNYLSTARNGNNAAQNQTATVDTQAQTQYTNNNGGVANGINGQQNGNGDFSAGLQGRPDGTAFDSAVPNRGSNDGRANSGLSDGVLLTSKKTRQIMDERGLPNLGLKESTGDNTSFSYALEQAKANNPHGAFVDSQSAENLNASGTRTFLSSDGMAGVAVRPDGDIVGVFKNSQNRTRQAVKDLLITALSNGGTKLDCYGNTLGKMYAQMGFVPVARMDFNPEYATDWKPEFGTPDVIFWMHNGDSPELVASKSGTYSDYSNDYIKSLPTFTDYEAAGQYRDMLLAQQQAGRTQNVNTQNPYDINPKLKKAGVNAENSVGAAQSGFDPYSKMVNDYGAIPQGMNPARMVDVPQSTNGTDRVSNVARTIMESGVTPDNLIPALENHIAEGLFSHDVKSLKKTLSGATKTIQKKGWQGAFDQWEEVTDGRRAVTDDDIALGQMMYTAAVEAGDTQTAMKLAGDLAVQGTALGRGVNAFKLLKKTTPEGQLYYLQKAVQKIQQEYQSRFDKQAGKDLKKELKRADTAGKRGKQTAIISDTNAAIEQAAQEVAKESTGEATTQSNGKENGKRTLPKATDKGVGKDDVYDGRPKDRYTPAADWAKETGNDLAKRIADKLNPAPTQRPVSRTILSDLMQFAEEHALPKKQQAPKRQAVDRLRDYFANKDFYTKAWNEARSALKEKYKGNAEALDALESFTDATIDYNADPLHTQKVIMNALMDDIKETGGLKTYLARNTLGAGEQNAAQLADRLIAETGVTGTDAEVLRSGVNHAYEDMMDGKNGTKLETMIRETLKGGNLSLTDVAKMSPKQKAAVGQTISGLLQKQYGVDAQYADTVSNTIIDEYNTEVQERARKILENKFKERKQRVPREFWDVFEEYANLGTFNSEYAQKATEKLFGEPGITLNEDLVQEFLNAETQEARDAVVDNIYNDVAQQIPKTAGDIVNAWRYFAMLGNPRTHIRNIMGNVASAAALDTSHKVSAVGQKFLPQEKRTRALHTSKAAKQFAKADYANVEAELSGNAYKNEMSEIKQRQKLFPKPLQKVMDANTRALDAEDQVFKKKSYIDSMGNFLTARGWDVNNLTEAQLNEARQHAIQDAKIATFQDASKLADKLSEIEHSGKAWGVIIGSLFPFKRTPINVAKRSFEFSPLGLLKAVTYDMAQVKSGKMDATKMADHISQGLTGSGIAVLGAFLAAQGIFSAGSSDDDKEANFDAGMGQQEYAINIGGKSYTIDWASPAVVPLAMGGELYNSLHQKYDDEETAFNQAMATVSRMFDPMLNMTMLSGIGSTVTSAAYNKSNPLFGIASNVATNFGGQFVPTLFGQVARTVDNTRRTTYADKNSPVPSSVQKFLQRQANKIPGLSQYQPAYTDVWGREQKNGPDNVFARVAYNFFSPGYLADAKGTQAEKALKELYQATGNNSVLPSKPQKYYKDADGVKKFLSASDYSKLTSEGGKISLDAINKLTKSEAYKQMSNDERIEAVADIYKYAKAIAANKVYKKELDGTTKIVSESGIEPGLYYAYKEMEDSYNDSMESWEARDQVFSAIKADSSLSDQEKNGLYHTLLIKGTSDSQWEKYQKISGKVTAEEYVDAMIQKQAITKEGEEIEDGRASLEATEFSYYLDSKGYTGEKRQAFEDTFKFYSMHMADPANYTFDMIRENGGAKEKDAIGEVESAGISAAQYAQIKSAASGVTYEKGKKNAKLAAVGAVVSKMSTNYDQYAAVMHALGYKNIDSYYTNGGKLPENSGLNTGINVNRSSASQKTSSAGFVNPTTASNSVVTSGYGGRNAPKTSGGYGSSNHDGIDIGGTGGNLNGQAADSIGGGKVTEVGYDENGYGNYVVVDHGNGYTSLYGHLQKATVKQGETVSAGQQVGVIGSTGNSSGPHLHLRVRKNGQSIDPRTVIPGYK